MSALNLQHHGGRPARGTPVLELTVAATLEAVSAAGARVGLMLDQAFGEERSACLRLGLVEAMTNIVEHGYAGRSDGCMRLSVRAGVDQWTFTLADRGRPIPAPALRQADGSVFGFDPCATAALPERGMGLSLIRMVFDQVDYTPSAHENRLHLQAGVT